MRKIKTQNLTHKNLNPQQHTTVWNDFFTNETKTSDDFIQDRADYLHAITVLERKEPRTSLTNVRAELGLTR